MWWLTIIGLVISFIQMLVKWFSGMRTSGQKPGERQMAELARLHRDVNKLKGELVTFGVSVAPEDDPPQAEAEFV